MLEPTTGQVLFADNADLPVPTASMVKMMTSLIVMEEIRDGRLTLETPVTISARSSLMGGSQIYAKQGQVFPVRTLLGATMVQSANDAAVALAEKVSGSTEAFAARMNQRGKALGLTHSTFYDPHGLPASDKRDNVMSAHDLATLGMELMEFPLMREFAAMQTMPFSNGTFTSGMTNPNHLLREYDGAYGIKTGYTVGAGFSITAAARRGGMDLIAVVTGAKQSRGPTSSFSIAGRLLDEAFATHTFVARAKRGAVVGQATVVGGAAAHGGRGGDAGRGRDGGDRRREEREHHVRGRPAQGARGRRGPGRHDRGARRDPGGHPHSRGGGRGVGGAALVEGLALVVAGPQKAVEEGIPGQPRHPGRGA